MSERIIDRVLSELSDTEGFAVREIATSSGISRQRVSSALATLKRKGLAECGRGTMDWSWRLVPITPLTGAKE